jgi:hypothetical protein
VTDIIAWPEETTGSTITRAVPLASAESTMPALQRRTSPYASSVPAPRRRLQAPAEPAALSESLRTLAALQYLRTGWDGENAASISASAIAEARRIITTTICSYPLLDRSLRPHSITPVPNGGVQIEWRTEGRLVELEVDTDGQISLLFADRTGPTPRFVERHGLGLDTAVDFVTQVALAPYSA